MTERSIRNNNPGNIRLSGTRWEGQVSGSDSSFATFATPAHGVRAMARTLETYQDRHGLGTVREMVSRWAPPNENDTNNYVNFVAGQMGVNPDQPVDLSSNPNLQSKMIGSMIRMEGGPNAEEYFAPHLSEGIRMATGNAPSDSYVAGTGPSRVEAEVLGGDPRVGYGAGQIVPALARAAANTPPDFTQNISWDNLINGTHIKQNALDQYDNYIYNIELFLVDANDTREFLEDDAIGIKSSKGEWPTPSMKKVVIAATGETSEIFVTDLQIETKSFGSSASVLTNSATSLTFTITRVGHGRISDVIQNAVLLAGYPSISSANFFVKIDFEGYTNGSYVTIPNSTKVIPFKFVRLSDIQTKTDQGGITAVMEGTVMPRIAVQSSEYSQLSHAISFPINMENGIEVLEKFMEVLNDKIIETHPTRDDYPQYLKTYKIEFTDTFREKFGSDLKLGSESMSSLGSVGGGRVTQPNSGNSTTGSANPTLDLNTGTSITDVIVDVLKNIESIKNELVTANRGFSNVPTLSIRYVPKDRGYNIMTATEGAEITYVVGIKRMMINQNYVDSIYKLTNVDAIINEIIDRARLSKVYNYYYTGLNDQVIEFNISLNKQFVSAYNDSHSATIDINEINSISEYVENIIQEESNRLTELRNSTSTLESTVQDLTSQRDNLERQMSDMVADNSEFMSVARDALNQVAMRNMEELGEGSLSRYATHNMPVFESPASMISYLEIELSEGGLLGDLAEDNPLREIFTNAKTIRDNFYEITERLNSERINLNRTISDVNFGIATILGQGISDAFGNNNFTDSSFNFERFGITENSFVIEDLTNDIRSLIDNDDLLPLIKLSIDNGVRFRRLAHQVVSGESVPLHATNRSRTDVVLAREKFREAYRQDESMLNATMTIKGDPFWLQNFKNNPFLENGEKNIVDGLENDNSDISGNNCVIVVSNALAGTDDNHNPNITNLFRYMYAVKSVTNSFSGGLFTQTLNMTKFPIADAIEQILPEESGEVQLVDDGNDISYGDDPILGEFGGITINPPSGDETPPSVEPPASDPDVDVVPPAPLPFTPPDEGITTPDFILDVLPDVTEPVPFEDRTPWTETRGSYVTLVDEIITTPFPTEDQSARFLELYEIAYASAENGNEEATNDVNSSITAMIENFGPTRNDADAIIQDIINSGEYDVSAEFLVMIDVVFGQTGSGYSNLDASTAAEYTTIIEDIGPNSFYRITP